jgi:hypothetical protein
VLIDGGEIHEHTWMRPADAHARRDAGTIELSPPTWVTLWELQAFTTAAEAVAGLAERPIARFATNIVPAPTSDDAGGAHLVALWAGDAGYADGDPSRPGARHRLDMDPRGWRYERVGGPS